eukprot:15102603-Heterocapsa_arctica.AAC.1
MPRHRNRTTPSRAADNAGIPKQNSQGAGGAGAPTEAGATRTPSGREASASTPHLCCSQVVAAVEV